VPDAGLTGSAAVVLLGSLAAFGWGLGDFGGGLLSRRAPLMGVLLGTQVVAVAIALPLVLAAGEPVPTTRDLLLAGVTGVAGAVGVAALYHGLSLGRMGVIAPIAGVLTAALPVAAGVAFQGWPSLPVAGGIGLALVSVILVTRGGAPSAGEGGALWGLLAGVGFGVFVLAISQVSPGAFFGPLLVVRGVMGTAFVLALLATRAEWRIRPRLWPAVIFIAGVDMAANVSYLAASRAGPLTIAASLSSLYPVVTVILAAAVLRERVTLAQGVGVVVAGLSIVLIAAGQA
jgi:drug/metabolite transporter (DMT)-like permease